MSIYEKTNVARALLYWAKNNNGNDCYYLEDRMYAVTDGDMVIILTADSYDEAKRKAKARHTQGDLISREALKEHKFLSPQVKAIGGRRCGKTREQIIEAYQKGWNDCIDAIIDNAPTVKLAQDRWIPVSERLPDKEGRCLVTTDYGDVCMDSFVDGMFVLYLGNVIAWQPLPEPYKEGKQ